MAATILTISDGTNFADISPTNARYMLARDGWAPQIAALRESQLGGRGPYSDVAEEIEINILGATQAEVLQNLERLSLLLDQAYRFWRRGENVAPVTIRYQPKGASTLLHALVLGRAPGDETGSVNLPMTTNKDLAGLMIAGLRLRFVRSGLWLNPNPAVNDDAGLSANPTVNQIGSSGVPQVSSPTGFTISTNNVVIHPAAGPALLLWASVVTANRLKIIEAESTSFGSFTTSVADAAAKARGGNVARYTPTDTNRNIMFTHSLSGVIDGSIRRFSLWAVVRNNSGTTSFTLQAQHDQSTAVRVPIDTSTANPRIVFLGTFATAVGPAGLTVYAQASAASGTLDMDYFVLVAADDERSGALVVPGNVVGYRMLHDPRPLTAPTPIISMENGQAAIGYLGDAMIHTATGAVDVTIIQPCGSFWRQVDSPSGTNVINNTWRMTRYLGYLTPR